MMHLTRKLRLHSQQRRRGTTVVEAALVLPIFLMFLLCIVEIGRYFMMMNVLKSAARAGARHAVARESTVAEVRNIIQGQVGTVTNGPITILIKDANSLDPLDENQIPKTSAAFAELPNYNLDAASESDSSVAGDLFLVRVEVPYSPIVPAAQRFLGRDPRNPLIISGQAMMRRE